jgi:hypothetical protein
MWQGNMLGHCATLVLMQGLACAAATDNYMKHTWSCEVWLVLFLPHPHCCRPITRNCILGCLTQVEWLSVPLSSDQAGHSLKPNMFAWDEQHIDPHFFTQHCGSNATHTCVVLLTNVDLHMCHLADPCLASIVDCFTMHSNVVICICSHPC